MAPATASCSASESPSACRATRSTSSVTVGPTHTEAHTRTHEHPPGVVHRKYKTSHSRATATVHTDLPRTRGHMLNREVPPPPPHTHTEGVLQTNLGPQTWCQWRTGCPLLVHHQEPWLQRVPPQRNTRGKQQPFGNSKVRRVNIKSNNALCLPTHVMLKLACRGQSTPSSAPLLPLLPAAPSRCGAGPVAWDDPRGSVPGRMP